ncbi:MAG: glycine zipper 2TM domain-containing protein [Steroidobacteraceae bacterium]
MRSHPPLLLAGIATLALLAACNKPPPATSPAVPEPTASAATDTAAAEAAAVSAREAEVAQREADIAAREAALATASAKPAQKPVNKPVVVNRPPASSRPVTSATPTVVNPPPMRTLTVPTGTVLSLSLATPLSSKSASVGDAVKARITSDVLVDSRVAIPAGTMVSGQVTDVISGSNKIGGIPTLGVRFETLELPGGDLPIDGVISQKGKSDTGRDTAKIVGGAAAGAILGHQVKGGDKGKVIGGLLGGAIGAVAAQKTGTEVQLPEGTALSIALASPVDVRKP